MALDLSGPACRLLASTNKSLAEMNKSGNEGRATKK
jgi:hypothetical protein